MKMVRYWASVSLFALAATPALAQAVAAVPDEGMIVVTAQKRVENIQDVPISLTAVTGDRLIAAGITDLASLDRLVPGLQFGQSGNDARPAIRGARTENISNQQDPIISFFVDGVYRSRTAQALAAFTDVSRVEVLRGPQGTLYGRNSFGGAINVISNAPTQELSAGATLTAGNYKAVRAEGFVNVPLTDTLSARVSGSYDTRDGYVRNTFDRNNDILDKNETYVRAQLRWEPSSDFDATVRASIWRQGGNGGSDFGYFNAGTPIDPNGGAFTYDDVINASLAKINLRVGSGNTPSDAGPFSIERDADFVLDTDQRTIDLEANYDFGPVAAKLLVGYTDFRTYRSADADLSILPSGFEYQDDSAETFSQEFQLNSTGDGPLSWTVGAFHMTDDTTGIFAFDRISNTDPLTNRPIPSSPAPTADFNSIAVVNTDSLAFFGQSTYSITEALRVTGGVRWTRDSKDFSRQTNGTYTQPLVFTGVPFKDSATFEKVTWRAVVEGDLTKDNLLYASVSTGFQAGGFNNSADAVTGGASFDEQTITAYEIGSKNSFLNGTVTANLSLYWNEFRGLLANAFVDAGNGTILTISTNAGSARARGAELELNWRASDAFNLNAGLTYNDATFGNYTLQEPVSGAQRNLDGGRIPFTPDFTARVGGEYRFDLEGGARVVPGFNVYYSSSFATNDIDYRFAEQSAYARLDLTLAYRAPDNRWFVQAFGNNVTDKAVLTRTVRFGQNAIAQAFAPPATYGVRLGFNY